MLALIETIKVSERIRKEITKIDELAENISKNGLLNPITVMSDGGDLRLLAGLRRLKAVLSLGWTKIEVNVISPANAEAALLIEISENEQREPFTFSEKMDFARLLEEIETAKSKIRQVQGSSLGGAIAGKGRPKNNDRLVDCGPQAYESSNSPNPKSREVVGAKIGMSGRQYDRAKYITANATETVIEQIDNGERTIRSAYDELRASEKEKKQQLTEPSGETGSSEAKTTSVRATKVSEKSGKSGKSGESGKIEELQQQLKEARTRAAVAESDLSREKELHHNTSFHKNSIITGLQVQISELTKQLDKAEKRIKTLESGMAG